MNQTTSCVSTQCFAHSVGVANSLFVSMIQTLLLAQCSISPSSMWPTDYGKIAKKKGNWTLPRQIELFLNRSNEKMPNQMKNQSFVK